MHQHHDLLLALVGQPNSGKSTVFNALTGLHQTTANYPGVTVSRKFGHYHEDDRRIEVVDLPGTYSLASYSQEERVTRNFLILERPEAVVAVVDAANLRRSLFLVLQLLELQVPILLCLNMIDLAEKRGMTIDIAELSKQLGIPVVAMNAKRGIGLDQLRKEILQITAGHEHQLTNWKLDYGQLESFVQKIETALATKEHLVEDFSPRWLAVKLLENDREARRIVQHHTHDDSWPELLENASQLRKQFETDAGNTPRKVAEQCHNEKANDIEQKVLRKSPPAVRKSDSADKILCHPIVGLLCVAVILYITFQFAFLLADTLKYMPLPSWSGQPQESGTVSVKWHSPVGFCNAIFKELIPLGINNVFALQGNLRSFIEDGILVGVGSVIAFVPLIFFIFLLISILDQCGYMARVVVVTDRLMRLFGLHGLSVLPMIIGGGIVGGCAVPAILATRSMRERRERLLTILVIPLMNCGAKIPIYALLVAAFFTKYQAAMLLLIVLLSWTVSLLSAGLLGKIFVRGKSSPLLIELPTYQWPSLREVFATATQQSYWFVQRAGTVILAANVILWVLMTYPNRLEHSYAAKVGRVAECVTKYAGFDWRDNVALLGGFATKEVIVSTLSTIYSVDSDETKPLAEHLQRAPHWSPIKGFAFLIFAMFYAPCIATCVTIRQETGSKRYMALSMLYSTLLALALAIAIFQLGSLIG